MMITLPTPLSKVHLLLNFLKLDKVCVPDWIRYIVFQDKVLGKVLIFAMLTVSRFSTQHSGKTSVQSGGLGSKSILFVWYPVGKDPVVKVP